MQAYAEGFDLFDKSEYELQREDRPPLEPGPVVRSWLCELPSARSSSRATT